MKITGKTHCLGDYINTDVHCSSKYLQAGVSEQELLKSAFAELKPGFSESMREGDILVAGVGFGTVSAREEAPKLMRRLGIRAVVAKSFGYLFYRNAINVGMPLVECDTSGIQDGDELTIDLEEPSLRVNSSGESIAIKTRYSHEILQILQDGGLIAHLKRHGGYAF